MAATVSVKRPPSPIGEEPDEPSALEPEPEPEQATIDNAQTGRRLKTTCTNDSVLQLASAAAVAAGRWLFGTTELEQQRRRARARRRHTRHRPPSLHRLPLRAA